jgi:hypothetical protein
MNNCVNPIVSYIEGNNDIFLLFMTIAFRIENASLFQNDLPARAAVIALNNRDNKGMEKKSRIILQAV